MFCAGFLAATWTYLLLGQLQGRQGMELILDPLWQQVRKDVSSGEYTHDQVALNVGVIIPPYPAEWQPTHEAFLAVGVRLTALGLGVIGGWLAVVLWRPSQPRSGDTFQPPA
jgi:hypothetical protein